MTEELTDREKLLIGALASCVAALRRIDSANGALSEGAGHILYSNPDRLAQALNRELGRGQNAYIQAGLLMDRLGIDDGTPVIEAQPVAVVGLTADELIAMIRKAASTVDELQHLIGQTEAAERAGNGSTRTVRDLRDMQQLWLGLSSRLSAAVLAVTG